MSLHASTVDLLTTWTPPDPQQEALRAGYLAHLAAHPDAMVRTGPPAHLTASCLVLNPAGTEVLLTLHRKGRFWVQFGGHCEPGDADLRATALREGVEESGLTELDLLPVPVDLHRHALPSAFGRCREHLDVMFLAVAPDGATPVVSDESDAVAWFGVHALPQGVVGDLQPRLDAARRLLRQAGPVAPRAEG